MFVNSTGRCASIRMSTIGSATRSSTKPHVDEEHGRQGEEPDGARRAPAPRVALREGEEQRDEAAGEEQRAGDVDARLGLDGRLGHEHVDEDGRAADQNRADDEDPPPGELVDEHAREHEPEAAAHAEHRGDQADRRADLARPGTRPDDREAEREDGAADTLQRAPGDQRPDAPRERRADAADEEHRQADQQHPLLPVLVAELAEQRRRRPPR